MEKTQKNSSRATGHSTTAERDERASLHIKDNTENVECQMRGLRQVMKDENITPKQIVQEVKPVYPGFDKTLLSKCLNADKYGVTMTAGSFGCLAQAFPQVMCEPQKEPRRADQHRLKDRVTCRLEKGEFEVLQRLIREDGFDTMQSFLAWLIRQYIKSKEDER